MECEGEYRLVRTPLMTRKSTAKTTSNSLGCFMRESRLKLTQIYV